jgi:hypothetical protein
MVDIILIHTLDGN